MREAGEAIRVALVSSDVSPQSGAALCLIELAEALQRDGSVSPLLYLSYDGPLAERGRRKGIQVRITGVPRPSLRKGALSWLTYLASFCWHCVRLALWLRRDRADLMHANEFIEFHAGVSAALLGLPRLYHVRWPLTQGLVYRILARVTALVATEMIAVSRDTGAACHRACAREPTVVYDPAPDPAVFGRNPDANSVRREFGFPDDCQLIIQVSKLSPEKGHEVFLRAAALVAESDPTARFLVVGGELPGAEAYARHLYALANQPPLAGRVAFAGQRDDIPRLLGASQIAVHLPLFSEPFGRVVVEAMSCGCAVVAAAIGAIPDHIEHGVSGLLVEPGDSAGAARAIQSLLSNRTLCRDCGEAARERVQTLYSPQRHVVQILQVYRRLAASVPVRDR